MNYYKEIKKLQERVDKLEGKKEEKKKITLKEFFDSEDDLCIHCDTKEKAKKLLRAFDKMGKRWFNMESYADENYWYDDKEDTCYTNDYGRQNINDVDRKYCKVYEFEDIIFEEEKFTEDEKVILRNLPREYERRNKMTKEELEEKIENKESVWVVDEYNFYMEEIKIKDNYYVGISDGRISLMYVDKDGDNVLEDYIERLFSTKAQAQHYLDNSNVVRTEKLPYVTWEEFKRNKSICFNTNDGLIELFMGEKFIGIIRDLHILFRKEATEENFYKAYDICKKLFLGEDIN